MTDPGVQWRVAGLGCRCQSGNRPAACSGCGAPGPALARGGHSPAVPEPASSRFVVLFFTVLGVGCSFRRKKEGKSRKMTNQRVAILEAVKGTPVSPLVQSLNRHIRCFKGDCQRVTHSHACMTHSNSRRTQNKTHLSSSTIQLGAPQWLCIRRNGQLQNIEQDVGDFRTAA